MLSELGEVGSVFQSIQLSATVRHGDRSARVLAVGIAMLVSAACGALTAGVAVLIYRLVQIVIGQGG